MGGQGKKKRVMAPADEVDLASVKYQPQNIQAPHLTGFLLKLFVWVMESPLFGPIIISSLKAQNKMNQLLRYTVIPEQPMYRPEFPPQEPEGVVIADEERDPIERLETANHCLPNYEPSSRWGEKRPPFIYWKIRDFAHAYRSHHHSFTSGRATNSRNRGVE